MRTGVKFIVLLCLLCSVLLMFACCGRNSDKSSQTGNASSNTEATDNDNLSAELDIDRWQDDEATTPTTPSATNPEEEAEPKGTTPAETKPKETKPKETKPKETKPEETKPTETKPEQTTPNETKPNETKPNGPVELPIIPG